DPVTNSGNYTGDEGTYNVTVRASDGSVSNVFTWDVGRWAKGDVFIGSGLWTYQVYSADGFHKFDLTVPDNPSNSVGLTTGCAANWKTGEVWATNFDDVTPAVNVFTRHAGTAAFKYTDASRRVSTERYGPFANSATPIASSQFPVDINPESVAFDNAGN